MKRSTKKRLNLIFKIPFYCLVYTGMVFIGPFILLNNLYKKRQSKIKYNNIVQGFSNIVFQDADVENLAKTRASICSRCPYAKESKSMKQIIIDNKTKEIQGLYCDACGCNLSAKIRSNSYCPKGKW